MRYAKVVLLLGCVVCIVWLVLAATANATHYKDARSTRAAHATCVRLANELREARHVESQTIAATSEHGSSVGRWVWLARDAGWPASLIPRLMLVIDRESSGVPTAKNPTSTASGLLQFLAFHWDGTGDYGWKFDPFNPRQNLYYGYKLYLKMGWSPWALTAY